MTTTTPTQTTADELATMFGESVRGVMAQHWPSPTAAEKTALDPLWQAAVELGWLGLGSEDALEATLAGLAELGRSACPFPLMDGYVAARLLAERPDLVDALVAGTLRVVVAIDGGSDTVPFVEAAPSATHLLLVPAEGGEASLRAITSRETTPGLAIPAWSTVTLGAPEAPVRVSRAAAQEALALLRLGLAVRAMAAAARAHEMAVEHAKVRHQFGKPIGSFQAVSQRLASCEIDIAAGQRLVAEAVRLRTAAHPTWMLASELAVAQALTAAPRVQLGAHHTFAAIGYFEEHSAPWLFRRVHADVTRVSQFPLAAGEPGDVLVETNATLPPLDLGETAEAFRGDLRALLAQLPDQQTIGGHLTDPAVVEAMVERDLFGFAWPPEFGGRAASVPEQMVFNEEIGYHRTPIGTIMGTVEIVGNAIVRHGTPEQRARFLPLIRRGELRMCLGYSEPEAGSDLASLRTRAERDGDGWVINGQKLWTTGGHLATHVWLATRTNPDAKPPHAGITVFLIPMSTPGITIQQHRALSGEISCTVFYDDVRVPDEARIGEVDGGWKVITDALASERVVMGGISGSILRQFDDLLAVIRKDPEGTVGPRGSAKRRRLTQLAIQLQANRALLNAAVQATAAGGGVRREAPMAKVIGGELAEDFGEATLEILGPVAALSSEVPGVPGGGAFEYGLRLSIMYVVGGGTNDIQRTLIARGLGLPR